MIGERQGHHPSSCQPATDATKDKTVFQFTIQRRCRENDRSVPVGSLKGLQPTDRVEHRRLGVSFHKLRPPCVLCRINLIKSHWPSLISRQLDLLNFRRRRKQFSPLLAKPITGQGSFSALFEEFCRPIPGSRRRVIEAHFPGVAGTESGQSSGHDSLTLWPFY